MDTIEEILIGNGTRYKVLVNLDRYEIIVLEKVENQSGWKRLGTKKCCCLSRRSVNRFLGDATGDPVALSKIYEALDI